MTGHGRAGPTSGGGAGIDRTDRGESPIQKLLEQRHVNFRSRQSLIVGASIGAGLAAHAARHGGADFILLGNVGRYRMMGAPSCACHLPLRDSNEMVQDFGRAEILPSSTLPIFLGVTAADPNTDLDQLVSEAKAAGFHGISNFPTATEMTGAYRAALEAAGAGFAREVELLAAAKKAGLATLAYTSRYDDLAKVLATAPDLICIMFDARLGLTASSDQHELEIAAGLMRPLAAMARKELPGALILCGGAAISNPLQMVTLCNLMWADGYIGGSTIDQAPLGQSIENRVAEFKTVTDARYGGGAPPPVKVSSRLVATSAPVRALYAQIARAARQDVDMAITGEEGTGKTYVSAIVHEISARRTKPVFFVSGDDPRRGDMAVELFGAVAGVDGIARERIGLLHSVNGGMLVVENVERMSLPVQEALLEVLEMRRLRPVGGLRTWPLDVRVVFTSREPLEALHRRGAIAPALYLRLLPFNFHLPPLRDRLEELPLLARALLASVRQRVGGRPLTFENAVLRQLQTQAWPGNLRLLRSVIEAAAFRAEQGRIRLVDLAPPPPLAMKKENEREQIVDALWRHKFRKTETADFLGISRKTLYNKMRKYGLLTPTTSRNVSPGP